MTAQTTAEQREVMRAYMKRRKNCMGYRVTPEGRVLLRVRWRGSPKGYTWLLYAFSVLDAFHAMCVVGDIGSRIEGTHYGLIALERGASVSFSRSFGQVRLTVRDENRNDVSVWLTENESIELGNKLRAAGSLEDY